MKLRYKFLGVGAITLIALGALGIYRWNVLQEPDRRLAEMQSQIRQWQGDVFPERRQQPSAFESFRSFIGWQAADRNSGSSGNSVNCLNIDATKEQLAELLPAQPFTRVNLNGCKNLDDDWIAQIGDFPTLVQLCLGGTGVTDRSTERFLSIKNLRSLHLVDTAISDQAVARLRGHSKLQELCVGGPNIRAVRLGEHTVLDSLGKPATRSGQPVRVQAQILFQEPPGSSWAARVLIRVPGELPAWKSVPYGWATRKKFETKLAQDSTGAWRLQADFNQLPPGKSTVEIWIDAPMIDRKSLFYRLEAFELDLAEPVPAP